MKDIEQELWLRLDSLVDCLMELDPSRLLNDDDEEICRKLGLCRELVMFKYSWHDLREKLQQRILQLRLDTESAEMEKALELTLNRILGLR